MVVDSNTYSEVYSYLEILGYDFIRKIPQEEYNIILKNRNKEYCPKYNINDFSKKLSLQAKSLIVAYHLKYWCNTEEEKRNIEKILKDNEEKIREKYEVFKNKEIENTCFEFDNNKNVQMIKIENNNIINKIKNFLKKFIKK